MDQIDAHELNEAYARLRPDTEAGLTLPPAGQPSHGRTAYLRRQPAWIADGRMEGGCTAAFGLI